jgi:hypothetical protein
MLAHTPKRFPHQGPDEEAPGGYKAVLLETRCRMQPTPFGAAIGHLAVSDNTTFASRTSLLVEAAEIGSLVTRLADKSADSDPSWCRPTFCIDNQIY